MWVQFLPGGLKNDILLCMHIRDLTNEEKLDAIYEMTKENHEILKTIRKQNYFSTAFRVLYWMLVIGFIGGAYFYVRPFVGMLTGNASKIEEMVTKLDQFKNTFPETKVFNQMLQGIQKPAEPTQ